MPNYIRQANLNILNGTLSGVMEFGPGLNLIGGENGTLKTKILQQLRDGNVTVASDPTKALRIQSISPKRNSERRAADQILQQFRQQNRTLDALLTERLAAQISDSGFENYPSIGDLFYLVFEHRTKDGGDRRARMDEIVAEFNVVIRSIFREYTLVAEWNQVSGAPRIRMSKGQGKALGRVICSLVVANLVPALILAVLYDLAKHVALSPFGAVCTAALAGFSTLAIPRILHALVATTLWRWFYSEAEWRYLDDLHGLDANGEPIQERSQSFCAHFFPGLLYLVLPLLSCGIIFCLNWSDGLSADVASAVAASGNEPFSWWSTVIVPALVGVATSVAVSWLFYRLGTIDAKAMQLQAHLSNVLVRIARCDPTQDGAGRRGDDGLEPTTHWILCMVGVLKRTGFEDASREVKQIFDEMRKLIGESVESKRHDAKERWEAAAEQLYKDASKRRVRRRNTA